MITIGSTVRVNDSGDPLDGAEGIVRSISRYRNRLVEVELAGGLYLFHPRQLEVVA